MERRTKRKATSPKRKTCRRKGTAAHRNRKAAPQKKKRRVPCIRNPHTGKLMQFTEDEVRQFNENEKEFFVSLRKRLGIPEPAPRRSHYGTVFYWDDHQPKRRLRVFTPTK